MNHKDDAFQAMNRTFNIVVFDKLFHMKVAFLAAAYIEEKFCKTAIHNAHHLSEYWKQVYSP